MRKFTDVDSISLETLEKELSYDSATGIFKWREPKTGRLASLIAGSTSAYGYKMVRFFGKWYYLHRLAWLFHYKEWPRFEVDHINGNPADNRIANLRDTTHSQNMMNARVRSDSSTGIRGVTYHTQTGKWLMRITRSFDTKEEAEIAFLKFSELLHNGFKRGKHIEKLPEFSLEDIEDYTCH